MQFLKDQEEPHFSCHSRSVLSKARSGMKSGKQNLPLMLQTLFLFQIWTLVTQMHREGHKIEFQQVQIFSTSRVRYINAAFVKILLSIGVLKVNEP